MAHYSWVNRNQAASGREVTKARISARRRVAGLVSDRTQRSTATSTPCGCATPTRNTVPLPAALTWGYAVFSGQWHAVRWPARPRGALRRPSSKSTACLKRWGSSCLSQTRSTMSPRSAPSRAYHQRLLVCPRYAAADGMAGPPNRPREVPQGRSTSIDDHRVAACRWYDV